MRKRRDISIKENLLFHRRIDKKTGCWLWIGSLFRSGYGCIAINKKNYRVLRIAWQEFIGPIKNQILHKQICPNKNCFNPEHLYDGTQRENVRDSIEIGTYWNPQIHGRR